LPRGARLVHTKRRVVQFEALRAAGTPVLLVRGQPQLGFNPQRLLQTLQQR
jgi:hypothetical protein